jgi:N-acetylglucosamine kinase-like BadF-type ATPase
LRRNLQSAAQGCPPADSVCGCFAGLVNEDLRARGEGLLRDIFRGAKVRAEPDFAAAFFASAPGTDVCVIAGTGSLVCSLYEGKLVKSGGRGFLLGDFGSGFHFGRDALIHFLDHPTTSSLALRQKVTELFDSSDPGTILESVYKAASPAGVLAKLAKPLGHDAQNGETYAKDSLTRNFGLLTGIVREHVDRFLTISGRVSVSLSGGVWRAAPIFVTCFEHALQTALPARQVAVRRISQPPVAGAVALARD